MGSPNPISIPRIYLPQLGSRTGGTTALSTSLRVVGGEAVAAVASFAALALRRRRPWCMEWINPEMVINSINDDGD